jgi:16S rRNA processing protein RimM
LTIDSKIDVRRLKIDWDRSILVGRIVRPHGLRGDVVVHPETDFVAERFRHGATFWTRSARGDAQLTVASARIQGGRPVVGFEGVSSIEQAQGLVGLELRVPEEALQPLEEGTYYRHQLEGCAVVTRSGDEVGTVVKVEGGAGLSRLVVESTRGEILVPLAAEICVEIDVAARRITIDPPEGLLELNEVGRRHDLPADGSRRPRGRRRQPGN